MKLSTALLALLVIIGPSLLLVGCESQPKKSHHTNNKAKSNKVEPPVPPCLKEAESTDATLLVIEWKRHAAHSGGHNISYFTFRYTPGHDDPASYESVRALICEHYVTSYTLLATNLQFAGKTEPITKIVVDADQIVHIEAGLPAPPTSDTSKCACP
jgi:hypothetical protein